MSKLILSARKIDDAGKQRTQCAVLPIFGDGKLAGVAKDLDKANAGSISQLLSLGDFAGKAGQSHLLPGTGAAARLLLIGCGKQANMDRGAGRAFGEHVAKALASLKASAAPTNPPL